ERQVKFPLSVNAQLVTTFIADAVFFENGKRRALTGAWIETTSRSNSIALRIVAPSRARGFQHSWHPFRLNSVLPEQSAARPLCWQFCHILLI
ncbi:MAG: hypothetical protein ACK51S_04950, partial [Alphaproteobacteria bacterium]